MRSPEIFPEILLGDITLREKQESDVEDFFDYYRNPKVCKHILCHIPQDIEDAKKELMFWRNIYYRNEGIYYAIALNKTNQMIGSIGISNYNSYQRRIELSYDLSEKYWRHGIMCAAIKKLVTFTFQDFEKKLHPNGINRIEAFVSTDNIASKNLLLKCGFTLEGILRQHRYHNGSFVDVYSFSIVKSDLNK
ncbi:MAG: GNAT family N-acetyltransferase [Rickettsiales bacterium]|nr:GNAT family N-acetyltransferase [Rickettsiales bacterium]